MLSFWNSELLDVDRVLCLQFNVVHRGGALSHVVLAGTDYFVMQQKKIDISLPKFLMVINFALSKIYFFFSSVIVVGIFFLMWTAHSGPSLFDHLKSSLYFSIQ
jgi:hypothetical protein